jgi:hypothetical protein
MNFETRCDTCGHIFTTEKDKAWKTKVKVAFLCGSRLMCDKCNCIGISAYSGDRETNQWKKILDYEVEELQE